MSFCYLYRIAATSSLNLTRLPPNISSELELRLDFIIHIKEINELINYLP